MNSASNSYFKTATPSHLKAITISHFKSATHSRGNAATQRSIAASQYLGEQMFNVSIE